MAAVLFCLALVAAQAPVKDEGRFLITRRQRVVGSEHFSIHRQGDTVELRSRLNYAVQGRKILQQAELTLGPRGVLRTYSWQQGKASIRVHYRNGRVQARYQPAEGKAKDFEFLMPAGTAILDENVYALWELLADRYDPSRGGAQKFSVFVPQSGDPGQVTIEAASRTAPSGPLLLRATTDNATLQLTLRGGRLLRLEAPADGLVVIRH